MADKIQFRRDTEERWSQFNPILMEGEIGLVTDSPDQYKIGDGETTWNQLPLRGFDGTISQTFGNLETSVMSQKVLTEHIPYKTGYIIPTSRSISCSIDENNLLNIPSNFDFYFSDGTFKRLSKSYQCQLHNGTSRILYDPINDVFLSGQSLSISRNHYIVGMYYFKNVYLLGDSGILKITNSGIVENKSYDSILDSELLQNLLVAFSSRSTINIDKKNKRVTVSSGDMYLRMGNGKNIILNFTEEHLYTFDRTSELVYNLETKEILIRDTTFGSVTPPLYNDVSLVKYDAVVGFCGGYWYDYFMINNQEKIIKDTITQNYIKLLNFNNLAFIGGSPEFNINLTTGEITITKSLDIYYGNSGFVRLTPAVFLSTIEATGTSRLWFDSVNKTFISGSGVGNDNLFLIGTVSGRKIYPNAADYKILYSDGTVQGGVITNDFVKEFTPSDLLPSFVMSESKITFNRFNEWVNNDEVVVFPNITDIHSAGNEKYKQLGYLAATSDMFCFDFALNNGDIGVGYSGLTNTKDTALEFLCKISIEQGKFNCPMIFAKGNHEQDGVDGNPLSIGVLSNYLQKPSQRKFPQIKIPDDKMYGFMDVEAKKTRIIFLDSNDSDSDARSGYQYHGNQLQWLINTLTEMPNDYTVVIASHKVPDEVGDWYSSGVPNPTPIYNRVKNIRTLRLILSSFVAKTSGSSYPDDDLNLTWNFTNSSGLLAGVICGDSHFDAEIKTDGVNIIITQGYGGIGTSERPPHAITTSFSSTNQMLVDIVAIKPKTRQMKIFRLGAGGEARDREFTY